MTIINRRANDKGWRKSVGSFSCLIKRRRGDILSDSNFFCYSTTLMHFLKANGLRYEYKTKHRRTGNRMWVFKRTDELSDLLDEYDERKAQARRKGII